MSVKTRPMIGREVYYRNERCMVLSESFNAYIVETPSGNQVVALKCKCVL